MNNSGDSEPEPCGDSNATRIPRSGFPDSDVKNESVSDLDERFDSILLRNEVLRELINDYDKLKAVLKTIPELSCLKRKESVLELVKLVKAEKEYLKSYDNFYRYNQLLEGIESDNETWRKSLIEAPEFKDFTETVKDRILDCPSQILALIRDVIAVRNAQADRDLRDCLKNI